MGRSDLPADLNSLKVTELKEELKARGLGTSGVKADLIGRLNEFISKNKDKAEDDVEKPKEQPEKDDENEQAEREKEQKQKQQEQQEEKEKEQKQHDKEDEEMKDSNATKSHTEEESKKRKKTDESDHPSETPSTTSTSTRTLTKPSSSSSSSSTPSSSSSTPSAKRQRSGWASKSASINISTDTLRDMLPTSPSSDNNDQQDDSTPSTTPSSSSEHTNNNNNNNNNNNTENSPSESARSRLTTPVYSTPLRREKQSQELSASKGDVPAPRKQPSTTLFIDKFVRPFTLPQVKQLLSQTGEVVYFWMNQVKSQAYATFETVEQATATREAVYDLLWPPGNGSKLRAEFSTDEEAKKAAEHHEQTRTPTSSSSTPSTTTTTTTPSSSTPKEGENLRDSRGVRKEETPARGGGRDLRGELRGIRDRKNQETPVKKALEDLFHKTTAKPPIYWLELSAEQIAAKKTTPSHNR